MATHFEQDNPVDLTLFRKVREMRQEGGIGDDDRIVFFDIDEPISLFSAFGHGADDDVFNGIVAANFRALNPGLGGR